ncbi:MAG: hypothetical protein QXG00_01400 [Candidatus Woesearchaeota archaeon]
MLFEIDIKPLVNLISQNIIFKYEGHGNITINNNINTGKFEISDRFSDSIQSKFRESQIEKIAMRYCLTHPVNNNSENEFFKQVAYIIRLLLCPENSNQEKNRNINNFIVGKYCQDITNSGQTYK